MKKYNKTNNLKPSKKNIGAPKTLFKVSFTYKIILVCIGVLLLSSVTYTATSLNAQYQVMQNDMLNKIHLTAKLASSIGTLPLITKNYILLEDTGKLLHDIPEVDFVALYDAQRQLLVKSGVAPVNFKEENICTSTKMDITEEKNYFNLCTPIYTAESWEDISLFHETEHEKTHRVIVGFIRLSFSKKSMHVLQKRLLSRSLLLALLFSFILLFVTIKILGTITRPLLNLHRAVRILEQGTYPSIKPTTNDEIGELTEEFNKMAKSINEREDALNQKNKELKQFTYIVSHDLKSPLLTIRGFIGLIDKNFKKNNLENFQKYVNYVFSAVDKMYSLLNEILNISRLGHAKISRKQVSLITIAEEVQQTFVQQLKEKNITLDISSSLGTVEGDYLRLTEAIQNLVENAIKFMGKQKNPHIEIGVKQLGSKKIYFVRDNGIGIKKHYQKRIFHIFDRLDQSTEGTGVGLAIAKKIIELHCGKIWVDSSGENKGSTFCFTLWETTEKG